MQKYPDQNPIQKMVSLTTTPILIKKFRFGKHKGKSFEEVAKEDSGYLKWMLNNQVLHESGAYPYGIYRWFFCDRWRLVYEHDASGFRLFGDLEELKELVRQGRTLQVGIRQLFGLGTDCIQGPVHISFVTTMQPVIQKGHVFSNCDLVLAGPPQWPFSWQDGLYFCVMRPSTSGEIECYLTKPGTLPFCWKVPRRGMQWMVADLA